MTERALRMFGERVDANNLAETRISYRVVGGLRNEPGLPPLPPAEEVLVIDGSGTARLLSAEMVVREAPLEADAVTRVFEQVRANLPNLVPRSEARFVPDSVVGEITVEVAGEQEQLYFPIEREERARGLPAEEGLSGMRTSLREVIDQVREEGGPSWP
jgi:hypothetical protein